MTSELIFNLLPYFLWLLEKVNKLWEQGKLRKELAEILEEPLRNLQNSLDSFFNNHSLCFGASLVGLFFEPFEPEKKAKEFFSNFERSYDQLIKDLKRLVKYINAHKEEFKECFKKDWLAIEAFVEAFKAEKPDWYLLLHHREMEKAIAKELKKEKRFIKELDKNFEEFNRRTGIDSVIPKHQITSILSILQSDECLKCIEKLKKYQKRT